MNFLCTFFNIGCSQFGHKSTLRHQIEHFFRLQNRVSCGIYMIGIPLVKKPRRVCRPQAANKLQSVFCGGVYVAKNTSQSASVEFVRFQRTNYARGRLQAFCPKRQRLFGQSQIPGSGLRRTPVFDCDHSVGAVRRRALLSRRDRASSPAWRRIYAIACSI